MKVKRTPREVPQEYTAFKNLLRRVVKQEPKKPAASARVSADKD